MLSTLSVSNYALIEELEIVWARGLNIITGETGAGKSILLGALGLILGNRADTAVMRSGERNCIIEAEFDLTGYGLEPLFKEYDLDYEPTSTIRRVITPAGKSRAYINDLPVNLTTLKEVGSRLIDIHSQHQTLLLGDEHFQLKILDALSDHNTLLEEYEQAYNSWQESRQQLQQLQQQSDQSARDQEYVAFQLAQLEEAGLKAGEQENLEREIAELSHASEIKGALLYATESLEADEQGILTQLKTLENSIGNLQSVYPQSDEYYTRLHSALLDLRDLSGELSREQGRIEADPQRLDQLLARQDLIFSLEQKHRVEGVAGLLTLQAEYQERLLQIEGCDERIEQLTAQVQQQREQVLSLATTLGEHRRASAPQLEAYVAQMLERLGIPSAQLKAEITSLTEPRSSGVDEVRFLFSANRNMPLQPIEKVASGGELSRLMLAIKALLANYTQMPTLIFDEIDTGVSGSIADRMGEIIVSLGESMQVINITHLPQVASKGENHYWVYKQEQESGTITHIRKLSAQEREVEIAKMLSGSDLTDAARAQARLLLGAK